MGAVGRARGERQMLLTAALLPIATAFSLGGAFARSTTKKLTPYRVNTPMHYAMRQMRSRNARNIVAMNGEPMIRIGHGWDIHRLAPREETGQACVIGGVEVENFELGTVAHSDGDVLYHSTVDAILGALTLPDIGQLFPDTDPKWKGCDSSAFLEEAWRLMDERGYRISNLDVTLVLQQPRVSSIKDKMKENLVNILKTKEDRVNIKARTHEKVDSIGEGRALSCHAVVLLEKKPPVKEEEKKEETYQ